MEKSKKKLPKFYLGTRKPTSLGYLPNYGIGTGQFTSVKGEDITPETRAMQLNIVHGALGKLTQYSHPALLIFLNSAGGVAGTIGSSVARSAAKRAGEAVTQFLPDALPGTASGANAATSAGNAAGSAGSSAASSAIGAAGTVVGALGTLYGLTDMGFLIANAGTHRTAADMRNTLATNTYTTAGGNQYTEKSGVDTAAELEYERANTKSKQFNFGATAIGTGAAAGATIGALAGSSVPILGTAIGAGVGGLIGLGAGLLGFGDNEDEVLAQAKLTDDISSMGNRQRRSDAYNLDVYNSFYNRSKNGPVSAANGKLPGYKLGKGVARLSGGEVVQLGPIKVEVPGRKNNKDEYIARKGTLLGEMMDDPRSIVYTNKGGISDYIKDGGDEYIALEAMKNILNKYKNGKLPGYKLGLGDYALSTIPHFYQFLDSAQLYNTDRNASTYIPLIRADYSGAKQAANRMIGDMEDVGPYLDQSYNDYKQALWNMQRSPYLGYGGRLLGSMALYKNKLAQDAKTRLAISEANRAQRNAGLQLIANTDTHEVDTNNINMRAWLAMVQQANAARDLAMRTDRKNMLDAIGGGAADIFKNVQYDRAQDYKERLMGLFENQQWLDLQLYLKDNPQSKSSRINMPNMKFDPKFQYTPKNYGMKLYTAPQLTPPSISPYTGIFKYAPSINWRDALSLRNNNYGV